MDEAVREIKTEDSRRQSMAIALAMSRGARYRRCRLGNFETDGNLSKAAVLSEVEGYATAANSRIEGGCGMILFGPPGTGKDHLMIGAAYEVIVQHGIDVKWMSGMDFYGDCRDRMDCDKQSEEGVVRYHTMPTVLAISDPIPPTGELTPYQKQMLYRVIDRRYSQMRPVWITINAKDRSDAAKKIGANILDRIGHDALSLHCNWPSYRRSAS